MQTDPNLSSSEEEMDSNDEYSIPDPENIDEEEVGGGPDLEPSEDEGPKSPPITEILFPHKDSKKSKGGHKKVKDHHHSQSCSQLKREKSRKLNKDPIKSNKISKKKVKPLKIKTKFNTEIIDKDKKRESKFQFIGQPSKVVAPSYGDSHDQRYIHYLVSDNLALGFTKQSFRQDDGTENIFDILRIYKIKSLGDNALTKGGQIDPMDIEPIYDFTVPVRYVGPLRTQLNKAIKTYFQFQN